MSFIYSWKKTKHSPQYTLLEQTPSQNPEYVPPPNTGSQQTPSPYPPEPEQEYPPQQGYPIEKQQGGQDYRAPNPGYVQQPAGFSSHTSNDATVVVQCDFLLLMNANEWMSHECSDRQRPKVVAGVIPVINDQMGLSIFAFLCCCWPIAILAIVKSSEARNRYMVGDYAGAEACAQSAKQLAYAAIICGLILIPLVIVLRVMAYSHNHN